MSEASQTFTGTAEQWEAWTGLALPGSGRYVIPDALAPLEIDRATDRGTCREPAIWVEHCATGQIEIHPPTPG